MAKTKKEFLLARRSKDDLVRLPSDEHPECNIIIDYVEKHYSDDIVGCLIPEGYKVAAVLIHDDQKNSKNDQWDFVIFDISDDLGNVETITLDNLDALESIENNGEKKLEVIKVIKGYFEEIIQESIGVIRKYKGKGQ
jgi:hypothetical protein